MVLQNKKHKFDTYLNASGFLSTMEEMAACLSAAFDSCRKYKLDENESV